MSCLHVSFVQGVNSFSILFNHRSFASELLLENFWWAAAHAAQCGLRLQWR